VGQGGVIVARWLAAATLFVVVACSATTGTVRGPVTAVDGDLSEVTSFSVLVEGDEWRFLPIEDGDYVFALQHLREHQRSGALVVVGWELRDDVRYALSIEDG